MNDEIQKKLDEAMDILEKDNVTDEESLKQRKLLNEILEVEPNNFDVLYCLGLSYMVTMENEQALKYFELAIQIKPEDESLKELINCNKEISELKNCENNSQGDAYNCKLIKNLSPITLFIVKIIILLVIFLLLNKSIF